MAGIPMNHDAPEIKSEIEDAKQDLREAFSEVNERVEEGLARVEDEIASFSPERSIKRRPMPASCIPAALGATVGSKPYQASLFSLALLAFSFPLIARSK